MNSYVPPNLQHRKGKLLAPNQAGLSLNSHYKKSFCWLKSFFRFGTENGKEKLKTAWRKIGEKKQNICFWEWVSEWETLKEENNLPDEEKKENSKDLMCPQKSTLRQE